MSELPSFNPLENIPEIMRGKGSPPRREFRPTIELIAGQEEGLLRFKERLETICESDRQHYEKGLAVGKALLQFYEKVNDHHLRNRAEQFFSEKFIKLRIGESVGQILGGIMAEYAVADLFRNLQTTHPTLQLYYPHDHEDLSGGVDWWLYLNRSVRHPERNRAIALQVKSGIARPESFPDFREYPVRSLKQVNQTGVPLGGSKIADQVNQNLLWPIDGGSLDKTVNTTNLYSNVVPALVILARDQNKPLINQPSGQFLDREYGDNIVRGAALLFAPVAS